MRHSRLSAAGAALALACVAYPVATLAQTQPSPGYFMPPQHHVGAPGRFPARAPAPAVAGQPAPPQQMQVRLPPAPKIPPIQKGPPTPAAIIGVVSIPDALRISTAYQAADKVFTERHKQLDEDAQKEQATLQRLSQELANERSKLSPAQIRAKERELQDRIDQSRRKFGERNQIIQESGQYVMAQINRTLEQVVQAVAVSRGINVVLNRAQVLGTTADFDMTPEVAQVLNKVLPQVVIPPDGVSPISMAVPKAEPAPPEEKKPEAKMEHHPAGKPVKH